MPKRLIRADGLDVCTLLEAIMQFFPIDTFVIDTFVEDHAVVMATVEPEESDPLIWEEFRLLLLAEKANRSN